MKGVLHQSRIKGHAAARTLEGTMTTSRVAKQPEGSVAIEPIHDISQRPQFSGLSGELGGASSLFPIQAKLTIGQPNDCYEQEADRVALEVVDRINAPSPQPAGEKSSVQRMGEADEELQMRRSPDTIQRLGVEEEELQMKPIAETIQREGEAKEELQMKPMVQRVWAKGGLVSADLEGEINSARGGGKKLAPQLQAQMGQAMEANFSGVRVHTDGRASQLNRSIQAKAFTTRQDIFFRQGTYQPGSREGQELIAHELTHVIQQSSERPPSIQLDGGRPNAIALEELAANRYRKNVDYTSGDNGNAPKSTLEFAGTLTNGASEYKDTQLAGNEETSARTDQSIGVAGGAIDTFSGIAELAAAIQKYRQGGDKEEVIMASITSLTAGARSTSATVDKTMQLRGDESAKEVSSSVAGVADLIGYVQSGYELVKKIVALLKKDEEHTSEEQYREKIDVVKSLLEGVKSTISVVEGIKEKLGLATTVVGAIPGLGIAVNAVDLLMHGYNLGIAIVRKIAIREEKRKGKLLLGGLIGKSSQKEAKKIGEKPEGYPPAKVEAARDYLLAGEFQENIQKTVNRESLYVITKLTAIAGDIVTLGGVTVGVGVGLRVAAAAIEAGARAFRDLKQGGRNKAAVAGESSVWSSIFNPSKSKENKLEHYGHMINQVFEKIEGVRGDEEKARACRVFVEDGLGIPLEHMLRYSKQGEEVLMQAIVTALQARGTP